MASQRVALVAGATGEVGQTICRTLAAAGYAVGVHYQRDRDSAEVLAKELRATVPAAAVAGDLTSAADADAVVRAVSAELGTPLVVVNGAYPRAGSCYLVDSTEEDVDQHLDGFRIHANLCRSVIPGMRSAEWGRIVLIGAALAVRLYPGLSFASGVKAGLTSFSRAISLEEGRHGVTVNVIHPGRVEFEGGEATFDPDPAYELLDHITRLRMALPNIPSPADIATVVKFLVSEEASAVTGQVVYVAGGEVM
jgi:NAD(P)-dependent dehydrogenase (short-subunit alcohol dehydrogenase family)